MKLWQLSPELLIAAGAVVLCGRMTGCGEAPGDEYRTYAETVSAASGVVPVVPVEPAAQPLPTESTADDLPPDRPTEADVANTLAVVTPGEIETRETAPVDLQTQLFGEEVALLTPREIRLLVPENEFRAVGPDGAVRVSYNDIDLLKVLNMDPVPLTAPDYFPDWLNGLDGQRIRIRGFMMPPERDSDLTGLLLARDNELCCFGRNPKPYDIVPVILREGLTVDYIEGRPFDVVGVFHVEVITSFDSVLHVYVIDDATVID